MAIYKQHTLFNLLVALPLLAGGIYYFISPTLSLLTIFASTFAYATLFMNPDLDLANQIRLLSIRGFFSLPFRSYAKCFKHRGLSHHPLFGSLTRILWLLMWGALLFLIAYKALPTKSSLLLFYKRYEEAILYGFAGICFADWGHLLLDRKK